MVQPQPMEVGEGIMDVHIQKVQEEILVASDTTGWGVHLKGHSLRQTVPAEAMGLVQTCGISGSLGTIGVTRYLGGSYVYKPKPWGVWGWHAAKWPHRCMSEPRALSAAGLAR